MTNFYKKLGFVEEAHAIETGEFIDQLVHLKNVRVETIKMKTPDGFLIELLKYHSHPQFLRETNSKSYELGCSHLAFTVDNIDKACGLIRKHGGTLTNPPAINEDGKLKVVYCHDPEGVLIELVEEL